MAWFLSGLQLMEEEGQTLSLMSELGEVNSLSHNPLSDLPPAHQEDCIIVLRSSVLERDAMAIHVREVLLCFFPSAGSETLIILHLPSVCILRLCAPSFKLWQTEEGMFLLVLAHLRTNSEDS